METLTDFATVQYFNQETITVGVFRIWRGSYDRDAASEIATLVLVFALLRHRASSASCAGGPASASRGGEAAAVEPVRLRGWRGRRRPRRPRRWS